MRGVVLCGGQSSRMGTDKGLLKQQNLTWGEAAVSKLSSLQMLSVLSVNKEQVHFYSGIFPVSQLIIDDESIAVKGPLLGLLSVHQQFPFDDLLVIACDMIDMEKATLQNLLEVYNDGSFDAYIFTMNGKVEPLCAIYTAKGLLNIIDLHLQKQLKKFSMMYTLECINTKYIPGDSFAKSFANYNSTEDLTANTSINGVS